MKIYILIIIYVLFFHTGVCQPKILDEITKMDTYKEAEMLPDSKTYLKTIEYYKNDKLHKKYTEESFYNYDTLKFCFKHNDKFYGMIDSYCVLRKINDSLRVQYSNYLYEDENEFDTTYIYGKGKFIDSTITIENGVVEQIKKFRYENGKFKEKNYYSKSFGNSKVIYHYSLKKLIVQFEDEKEYNGKSVYSIQDTIVRLNKYNKKNEITSTKEFIVLINDSGQLIEKREYDLTNDNERKLIKTTKCTYSEYKTEIYEELHESQIKNKTIIDNYSDRKIIETVWLKKNEKRIIKYLYLE